MPERRFVTYEDLDGGSIVRIMLNRPEARNAQNRGMLVELNDAFLEAEADDRVRVVIFGGAGKMFSAGHDMGSEVSRAEWAPGPNKESVNQTVDNMGFYNALHACFTLHELNHAHWAEVHEDGYPSGRVEDGLEDWRTAGPVQPAARNAVGGHMP
jgi:enoyl-CoA hydratase/carnithine racemase